MLRALQMVVGKWLESGMEWRERAQLGAYVWGCQCDNWQCPCPAVGLGKALIPRSSTTGNMKGAPRTYGELVGVVKLLTFQLKTSFWGDYHRPLPKTIHFRIHSMLTKHLWNRMEKSKKSTRHCELPDFLYQQTYLCLPLMGMLLNQETVHCLDTMH